MKYRTGSGKIVKELSRYQSNIYGTVIHVELESGETTDITLSNLEPLNYQIKLL